jgi:1-acyl-sn-glycerol-3-phosphate acyltransferase
MVDEGYVAEHAPWLDRLFRTYFRAEIDGFEHLPDGPFVAVGTHGGATLVLDTLVWMAAYARENVREGARVRPPMVTLAHDQMFDGYPKMLARTLSRLGAVRARPEVAREALAKGYAVQVYPGGDYDACRPFRDRDRIVFAGRRGYVDLARDAGVPIVPVVSHGAHRALVVLSDGAKLARLLRLKERARLEVFPLTLSLPWGLFLGPLPGYLPLPVKVRVRVLPAFTSHLEARFDRDEVDRAVRASLQHELDHLSGRSAETGSRRSLRDRFFAPSHHEADR